MKEGPGPDGFIAKFYQIIRDTNGSEVLRAVQSIFQTNKLLKQLNTITVTFNPKDKKLLNYQNWTNLSYCNILYKCLAKINY